MEDIFGTLKKAKKCTTTFLKKDANKQGIIITNLGKSSSTDVGGEYYRFEILYREGKE